MKLLLRQANETECTFMHMITMLQMWTTWLTQNDIPSYFLRIATSDIFSKTVNLYKMSVV